VKVTPWLEYVSCSVDPAEGEEGSRLIVIEGSFRKDGEESHGVRDRSSMAGTFGMAGDEGKSGD